MYIIFSFSKNFGIWCKKRFRRFGISLGFVGIYICWNKNIVWFYDKEAKDAVVKAFINIWRR